MSDVGMSIAFERALRRLDQQLEEGLFTRGAQMTVEIDGERVLDVAIGDSGTGTPMTAEHVFRVYCTIKPITAVAIARLVDEHVIVLDEPLEKWLTDLPCVEGGVTLRHVLTHTAGLHRPMAVEMEMVSPANRRATVGRSRSRPGWPLGTDAAYSEYAGWHVLGWLIEAVTGEPLREHLRAKVLEPLDMHSTWIGMTDDEYGAVLPVLGVNADMRNLGGYPMAFERSPRVCTETNPAHGGYTNSRDLAHFYSALLARLDGRGVEALPSPDVLQTFCSPARPKVYDRVLDRECSYGLGFMTDLSEHVFGDHCSSSSFGHSGNVGSSFAMADPERGLSVGVVFNGLATHDTAFIRRRALMNALYQDLDEHDMASMPAEPAPDEQAKRSRFGLRRRARR